MAISLLSNVNANLKEMKSQRIFNSLTYEFGIPMRQQMPNITKSNELTLEMSFMLFILYLRQRFDQRFRRALCDIRCHMPKNQSTK